MFETNDTAAPALCPRDNSCLFAFVKGADGKVGLYLNLRSTVSGVQTSCKLADVDATAGGTYLCFATIEVGTGKNGAERIRAFGVNVNDVTEQHIGRWAPSDAGRGGAVECELIGETSYPKHLAVGGQDCSPSFRFEEYARHRIDYCDVVSDLFVERYVLPLRDWCRRNGLLSSGHFVDDETIASASGLERGELCIGKVRYERMISKSFRLTRGRARSHWVTGVGPWAMTSAARSSTAQLTFRRSSGMRKSTSGRFVGRFLSRSTVRTCWDVMPPLTGGGFASRPVRT